MDPGLARSLGAEAIGTFALVFVGAGAIMADADAGGLGRVGVALAFGLVIMAMVYAVGHISGAHLNPAVTLAFAISRHFPSTRVPAYWAAQVSGATVAAVVLRVSLGDVANVGATMPSGSEAQSFLWEIVLTAILLFVIMAVATDTRAVGETAAIAIGGTIALASLVGGPVSGASMNPGRSLGPAIASGETRSLWLYLTAPLVGGALGAFAYQLVRGKSAYYAETMGENFDFVRAAGGVVVREGSNGREVLVVHRPKYEDWTFPKGKAEAGESDEDCALREVEEETGLLCALGEELPSTSYTDAQGRPKRVRYWLMGATGGALAFRHEVDEARWVTPDEALRLLTYDRDLTLLRSLSALAR